MKISVVIPTFNRLPYLQCCLKSLEEQSLSTEFFEVIVIVDGSEDGTVAFLKDYSPAYSLKYFFQQNSGLCSARNFGNRQASGTLIVCLDDDIIASPQLLQEHVNAHQNQGNILVAGAVLLHDSIPRTAFMDYERNRRKQFMDSLLSRNDRQIGSQDLSGGNLSLPKALLEKVNGFDEDLNRLSNTDGDLAYRLEKIDVPIRYCPKALAYLTYVKNFQQSCQEAVLCGKSYVFLQHKYPETLWRYSPAVQDRESVLRNLLRKYLYFSQRGQWRLSWLSALFLSLTQLAEYLPVKFFRGICYRLVLDYYFWQGVHQQAGKDFLRYRPQKITFLCYHNVSDKQIKAFRLYILPQKTFRKQMQWLHEHRYNAISIDQLYRYLFQGKPLPGKPILISFDDGYQELKETATPFLSSLGMKHVHFINSRKMGKTSDWVERAPNIPLLSEAEIQALAGQYSEWVDFQAHGESHLDLSMLNETETRQEIGGCVKTLEKVLNKPVNYLAYAFGEYAPETPAWIAALGLKAAFTVISQGQIEPGQNPYLLPRVEIFSNDNWLDFRFKVHWGRSPIASSRTWIKHRYHKYRKKLRKLLP